MENAKKISKHIQSIMGKSTIDRRIYLHVLVEDIPRFLQFWYTNLGIGIGALSTQAGETKNLDCYNGTEGHCNHGSSAMQQVVEYDTRRTLYCSDKRKKRPLICKRCSQTGHQQNSTSCILHPNTRTAYRFLKLEENCDTDELNAIKNHESAYVAYYRTTTKKGFSKMIHNYFDINQYYI